MTLPNQGDTSAIAHSAVSRRKPWVAVVLTLLTPGVGHVYSGKRVRGAVVLLLSGLCALVGIGIVMRLPGYAQLVGLTLIGIGLPVTACRDAANTARRQGPAYRLRSYNRWYVYAAVVLIALFGWQPILIDAIKKHAGSAYRLSSASMEPTMLKGDFILTAPLRGPVGRGDIVVHHTRVGDFAKRVVAMPGDVVSMRSDSLIVNGATVAEPYAQRDSGDSVFPDFAWQASHLAGKMDPASYRPSLQNWGPLRVPSAEYFTLGDNRNNSRDSRYLGFVPRDSLFARPTVVYFSFDPEEGAARWSRIGRSVQ